MASTTDRFVQILYRRPPDREDIFVQQLLERTHDCVVTFMPATPLRSPVTVRNEVVLDDGGPAIWFTFRHAWHDIGRFHRHDGTFTGTYANVITPVHAFDENRWETTDLFLDFWLAADGTVALLDENEFDAAVEHGWLDRTAAARARAEMTSIERAVSRGEWPPAIVHQWSLARAVAESAS